MFGERSFRTKEERAAIDKARIDAIFRHNRYSVLLTLIVAPFVAWFASQSLAPLQEMLAWWSVITAVSLLRGMLGWAYRLRERADSEIATWRRLYILLALLTGLCWGAAATPIMDIDADVRTVFLLILTAITAFSLFPNMSLWSANAAISVPINLSMLFGAYHELVVQPFLVFFTVAFYMPLCLLAARRLSISFDEMVGAGLEFKHLSEKAESANRAKTSFLTNMSHEIRTPLNGVLGMAELLQASALNADQRRYCQAIEASGRQLHELLSDILDVAKIEAGRIEAECVDFQPLALAEETAAGYRELALANGTLFLTNFDPAVAGRLAGDPMRLRQVLSNLLSNAVKFTQGGSVTLTLKKAAARACDDRTWLQFRVRDTGVGMAPEELSRLFRPFVQADSSTTRRYGGSGLGLVICKHLVELMGGSLEIESSLGVGTSISFELPFAAAAPSAPAPEATAGGLPSATAPSRAPRVLVAEDNPVNQEVTLAMLSRLGAISTLVEDGEQAVRALREHSFDLVLMDCQMPVLDGYQATTRIRAAETQARVPIVALTAGVFAEDHQRALDAGMDDYLAKPISIANLSLVLTRWAATAPG